MKSAPRTLALALASLLAAIALLALPNPASAASPGIALHIHTPTTAEVGKPISMVVVAENDGDAPWSGELTFKDTYPDGINPVAPNIDQAGSNCSIADQTVTCTVPVDGLLPGTQVYFSIIKFSFQAPHVEPGSEGTLVGVVEVSGGGAPEPATGTQVITVGPPLPFGIKTFGVRAEDESRAPEVRAASSPSALTTELHFPFYSKYTTEFPPFGEVFPGEAMGGLHFRNVFTHVPPGFIAWPFSTSARCTHTLLNQINPLGGHAEIPLCPDESQVGVVRINDSDEVPLYNMEPPPGVPAEFGFAYQAITVVLDAHLRPGDYGVDLVSRNTSSSVPLNGADVILWGDPANDSHDTVRGVCLDGYVGNNGNVCRISAPSTAFLRLPTHCEGPQDWSIEADSYEEPGAYAQAHTSTPALVGCENVPFDPLVSIVPTSTARSTPTGLDVSLRMPQATSVHGLAEADLKRAEVTLPQGMAINSASAGGLAACTDDQLRLGMEGAASCPNSSKIGTISLRTPLLEKEVGGSIFVRTQNSGDPESGQMFRIAVEVRDDERGVDVKLPGEVKADPQTGQLTATFDDNPQLPFSEFQLHFKSGPRAPLTTLGECGTRNADASLAPWSGTAPVNFSPPIGTDQGCAVQPLKTGFEAGTVNPVAGENSPFELRLSRSDDQPELERFTADLPNGLSAVLRGVPYCPPAALAAASRHGGTVEQANPSCPGASQIGKVDVGVGEGSMPFHVGGSAYLTGPYKGAPLGVAVVIPAVAGPFDLGTTVVRSALFVDPVDVHARIVSDPLPQIIGGVPVHTRSIDVSIDRPKFTLNPTNCDPKSVRADVFGVGGSPFEAADRFQVANCGDLGFKPALSLQLSGQTRRAGFPALRATLKMPPGNANLAGTSVALPRSEFLAQSHISTVCTRVQYAAGEGGGKQCPKGSVYGRARAVSPLLDEPLEGPVFLRSNGGDRELPDLVVALDGQIHVDLVGFVDSAKGGGLRTRFQNIPDAPVTKFVLAMKGGRKGLLENSTNLCRRSHRASVKMAAQNGKRLNPRPLLRVRCGGAKRHR